MTMIRSERSSLLPVHVPCLAPELSTPDLGIEAGGHCFPTLRSLDNLGVMWPTQQHCADSPSTSCNAGSSIHAHGLCVAVPSSALHLYQLQVARLHPVACSQRRPCVMPPCVRACCVVWPQQAHILHTTYTWVHMST